jgi:ATP-dependent RNA helicase DDX24/MAK5
MVEVGGGGGPKKMGGKFQRGGGGVTKKPKQSKVGSKVRRANKKAADAGPREAEMLVPGARKSSGGVASSGGGAKSTTAKKTNNSAEVTDLETVDWDKVAGWQTVKYDPNRLIFGAQEEGFVELEEMDMKDLGGELNALLGARSGAVGTENENNASKKKKAKDSGFETAALDDFTDHDGDFDEDDPAHFPEGVDDEDEDGEDTETRTTKKAKKEVPVTPKKEEKKKAKKEVSDADLKEKRPKTLSAKDARVEKRKLRWKENVEAAKLRKKYAREELEKGGGVSAASTGDGGTTDSRKNKAATRDATDDAVATTADPVGKSKLEGWHMDYNNYPTSGMGAVVDGVDLDTGVDVSSWLQFDLHPKLLRGLQDLGFSEPTPIQSECLNPAIKGRCDVIGAAETGSGKTLAFGIPILHRLLTQMDQEREESESESDDETPPVDDAKNADEEHDPDDPFANVLDESGRTGATAGFKLPKRRKALRALIVAPTRELAMQVCDMLLAIGKHAPEIGIVPVVGGMSLQKQERLLSKRPEIVVATPGRLWELMNAQGHEHFLDLGRLNFLVLDEADRMVERGHFQELHSIIDTLPMPPRVQRPRGAAKATPESLKIFKKRGVGNLPDRKTDGDDGKDGKGDGKRGGRGKKGGNSLLVDGDIVEENARAEDGVEISLRPSQMLDRQTFVFSATLTVPDAVRRKLKKGHMGKQSQHGGKGKSGGGGEGSLTSLMEQVPFYGRVKLVDLTNQSGTVAKRVMESALECTEVSYFFFFGLSAVLLVQLVSERVSKTESSGISFFFDFFFFFFKDIPSLGRENPPATRKTGFLLAVIIPVLCLNYRVDICHLKRYEPHMSQQKRTPLFSAWYFFGVGHFFFSF